MHTPAFPLHPRQVAGLAVLWIASAVAAGAATEYHINVDVNDVVRTVDDRHFGLNATIWDGEFANGFTTDLFAAAGTRALRFGGGSLSNEYHWQTNTTLNNTWEWATSFDEFAAVATAIHAQVFITANYGTGSPEEAAAWVAYSNVTKGYGFKYWEIGNENYGTWETDQQAVPHDPYTYAVRFKEYMAQMKAVDPMIKVGAVVINGEDAYANNTNHPATNPRTGQVHNGWTPVLLATLKSIGAIPDYVIYHRYEGAPGVENDAVLLRSARTWPDDAANLRQMLNDYLGVDAAGVEMVVTENNSVYGSPGKQSTSIVNGLFLADSFGNLLQTEFNAFTWWDVRNGQEAANNNSASLYGWRNYGDYGVLHGPSGTYPTYHVHKLLQHFARAGDQVLRTTSDSNLVSAFAVRGADGTVRVLIVTKYQEAVPESTAYATITVNGYPVLPLYERFRYGFVEDEEARTGSGLADVKRDAQATLRSGRSSILVPLIGYTAQVIVIPSEPPQFFTQPQSQAAAIGTSVTLVASAMSDAEVSYQWLRNGTAITGATSAMFTINNAKPSDSAIYTVRASSEFGTSTSNGASVVVGPRDGWLVNLSTRGAVRTGGELMIAGFYLDGTAPQTVLIRGIGPGLVPLGLNQADVLADPHITVFAGQNPILENDNWSVQTNGGPDVAPVAVQAGAFALDAGSKDAALVATLNPGLYSVHVTGAGGGTGIALAEVYNFLGSGAATRLVNISTRGYVGTGSSIIIPGIVVGSAGRTLLIRGVGPGIPGTGLPPVVSDPVLYVVDGNGNIIFSNDDWGSVATAPGIAAAASATGAFALADGSKDAALVAALPPGLFTVHVSDKFGPGGVALVEVYEMAP